MPRLMPEQRTDDAFAAFLELSRGRVLRFLRRLCAADAEDVLQETLAKVWRYRASWDPEQNGEGWLLRAAFRCFVDWRRRRDRAPTASDRVVRTTMEHPACTIETREELERALARLLPLEKALLLGFHAEGHSLAELAREHALPINTVKSHLHRARKKLSEDRHDT